MNWLGHITTITDTLGRTITFNYDGNANLQNITQAWHRDMVGGGQTNETHTWAQFYWTTATVLPNFSGVSLTGAANGESIPVINQVSLPDGSLYTFEYDSNTAQVSTIRRSNPPPGLNALISVSITAPRMTPPGSPELASLRTTGLASTLCLRK